MAQQEEYTTPSWAKMQELVHRTTFLNEICKNILPYNGKAQDLTRFRIECEEARDYVGPDCEEFLVETIVRSRINREVRNDMPSKKFKRITNLRELVSRTKSKGILVGELYNMFQGNDEGVKTFIRRIKEKANQIEELHIPTDGEDHREIKTRITDMCVEAFLSGVEENIGDHLDASKGWEAICKDAFEREETLLRRRSLRREGVEQKKINKVNTCQVNKEPVIECNVTQRAAPKNINHNNKIRIRCSGCRRIGHTSEECRSTGPNAIKCRRCSKMGHLEENCIAKIDVCQLCKGVGHTAVGCNNFHIQQRRTQPAQNNRNTNYNWRNNNYNNYPNNPNNNNSNNYPNNNNFNNYTHNSSNNNFNEHPTSGSGDYPTDYANNNIDRNTNNSRSVQRPTSRTSDFCGKTGHIKQFSFTFK